MPHVPYTVRRFQDGVALFTVIVFIMLSMLLALWASRTSLFNEMVVSNDADYQRAFEAAQALLQDAELDIRGENPNGSMCVGAGNVCRTATAEKIPLEAKDIGPLLSSLEAHLGQCRNGLCAKRTGSQDFWNNKDSTKGITLGQMTTARPDGTTAGARYGQFTGAQWESSSDKPINPILADRSSSGRGGWYWIEVLPYDESSKNSGVIVGTANNLLPLNLTPSVIYRITAVAQGLKSSTQVVLQQSYAQQKLKD